MGIVNTATDKYQKCIDICNRCAQACMECMNLCLNEPDVSARKKCIAKLHECACICKESASFMSGCMSRERSMLTVPDYL